MLDDVVLLAAATSRTKAYLSRMIEANLKPRRFLLLGSKQSELTATLTQNALSANINVVHINSEDINGEETTTAMMQGDEQFAVFSGAPGTIVRRSLFATGKRLIHVHPGRLPAFRGSTTIYYSLLKEGSIEATAIFLDEGLDSGPGLWRQRFDPPQDLTRIDGDYDAEIRAQLLIDVLTRYRERGTFEPQPQEGTQGSAYYVIHPVLKHLAILRDRKKT